MPILRKMHFRRVEAMVIMAGMDLPSHIVREYIVGALDIIIQATRLTDGTRKIVSISEILERDDGSHEVKEIFHFKRTGMKSDGTITGLLYSNWLYSEESGKVKGFWNIHS